MSTIHAVKAICQFDPTIDKKTAFNLTKEIILIKSYSNKDDAEIGKYFFVQRGFYADIIAVDENPVNSGREFNHVTEEAIKTFDGDKESFRKGIEWAYKNLFFGPQ